MRIAVICLASRAGGGLTVLRDLYQFACDEDVRHTWLFLLSDQRLGPGNARVRVEVTTPKYAGWRSRIRAELTILPRMIDDFDPDVVLSLQNIDTPARGKRPLAVYMHQSLPFQEERFSLLRKRERALAVRQLVLGPLIRASVRRAEVSFTQTQWITDSLRSACPGARVVNVGYRLPPTIEEQPAAPAPVTGFVYPAAAAVYKDHGTLHEAVRLWRAQCPDAGTVTLTITRDEFAQLVGELTDEEARWYEFVGTVSPSVLRGIYARSFLLFPSRMETLGLPLLEARASGTRIVAAETPFGKEALEGYEGASFFRAGCAHEMAKGMVEAWGRRGEALGPGPSSSERPSPWESMVQQMEAVLNVDPNTAESGNAARGARRLAVVVVEYQLGGGAVSGGLDAVTRFIQDSFTPDHGWSIEVVSPRVSSSAPESRRLRDTRTLLRGPRRRNTVIDGIGVSYFGAPLAELEVARYLPRKELTQLLDACDATLVVAGSPAIINVTRHTKRPVVAQVATFVRDERAELIRRQRWPRRWLTAAMTRLVARMDEAALREADVVLVENDHMYAACRRRGINVQLAPPGVDCQTFHPGAKNDRPGTVLAVGRWEDPRKGLETLLRAFGLARQIHGVQQRLVLAGIHEPTAEQLALIRSLGLMPHVDIRANVPTERLAALYRSADLFALTSSEEGLGLVFLEAMASGTPVLATETEGARHALGDSGAGALVPLGEGLVGRFADSLAAWCSDPARLSEAGAQARENAEARFDLRQAGERFRTAVEALLPAETADARGSRR